MTQYKVVARNKAGDAIPADDFYFLGEGDTFRLPEMAAQILGYAQEQAEADGRTDIVLTIEEEPLRAWDYDAHVASLPPGAV